MSKTNEHNKSRVKVENLQQHERELKNHEAESIKGGEGRKGGAMGGVDYRHGNPVVQRPIGEEIPSL